MKHCTGILCLILSLSVLAPAGSRAVDQFQGHPPGRTALEQGFQSPPNAARPRVWWHWLNANISREGVRKDLKWMQRSGIGGLQNFDVNFALPTIVDERVVYMSDEWKDVYRYSVSLADELGLEFGIAASPGWSETGGPWVRPEDGMKKVVWSETRLQGGVRFTGYLPAPPTITGPFQDLPPPKELNPTPKQDDPTLYRDIAVLALPAKPQGKTLLPTVSLDDGSALVAETLSDGRYADGVPIPLPGDASPTAIYLDFPGPQTVRSATLFIPDIADIYSGATVRARLEVQSGEGEWDVVSDFSLSTVPTTVSFAPVTSTRFRLSVENLPKTHSNSSGSAPGFDSTFTDAVAAYLAKKTLSLNELRLSPEARINQFEVKAGFSVARDYYRLDEGVDNPGVALASDQVLDLSGRLQPDGALDWVPPPGDWKVLRIGYSLLGKTNHPAIAEATGLEVDKLDRDAVRAYVETYLQNYRDAVGPELMGERGISALLTDSTEVGAFNWSPGLLEDFQRLRGYDALPWLPTLSGEIIGSRAQSDKFLYDFRRTIAELHASEHYRTVAEVAHEHGMKVYGESLEGWRPSLGDDMEMRRYADYPMSAIWSYRPEDGPKPLYFADMRGAASVAHLYGQNIAAAESMTSTRHPWDHVPADLRRVVDLEFVHGINRVVIHSSVHQPVEDKVPGLSLRHIGQFFNRHTAWAEMAKPWIDYIARNSFLLQQGRFVADVAYFYGEESPLGALAWDEYLADVPARYGYDFVNSEALLNHIKVDGGDLVSDGGARYRILYLGGSSERMTLASLRRIEALVAAGATVLGDAPVASPSLGDDAKEFRDLVERLWPGDTASRTGKGRIIAGRDIEGALQSIGVVADVSLENAPPDAEIPFVHRQLAAGDIYFLNNRKNRQERVEARFRIAGKTPEIWRADDGSMVPVSFRVEGDSTVIPLVFEPEDSYFVVFLDSTDRESVQVPELQFTPLGVLDQSWEVSFQRGRGAPESVQMPELIPLNEHGTEGVRYFSGISSYRQTFKLPAQYTVGTPLLLDLGLVGDLAEVRVNGALVGTLWHAPFRLDISPALKPGMNQLEIRVANRWVNRLIGDAQPGAEKTTFTVIPTYSADAPLRPSGLIGPVRLLSVHAVSAPGNP